MVRVRVSAAAQGMAGNGGDWRVMKKNKQPFDNQIAIYQSPDGLVNIEVLYADENIWLTQKKMAELFDCSSDNVSLHLKNIYLKRKRIRSKLS